jgi:uncharacterized protein (DUF1778 family)
MTKMTIEIPDDEYKTLKIAAIHLGVSIKDYVLEAIRTKEKILIRDDGVIRVLNKKTIKALEDSRKNEHKLKSFKTLEEYKKHINS